MAPIPTAVLLPAAAAVLMAMAVLQLSAAAAAARPSAPIGQPGCNTTCGHVSVPYPFGFGPSHCYWPGLNLTCDRRHHQPRLLLGDGSLQVTEISLSNQTVRVMRTGPIIDTTGDFTLRGRNASLNFGRGFRENGYLLSARNELVVSGCNVMATIWADIIDGEEATKIVGGCASFCTTRGGMLTVAPDSVGEYCTGTTGCCQAPLSSNGVPVPNGVQARWLNTGNHTVDQTIRPGMVFVVERGWADRDKVVSGIKEAPLLLDFAVTRGLPPNRQYSYNCSQDVQRKICKSEHSYCFAPAPGYACKCKDGYEGNPYLPGGCQDIDECKFPSEKRVCFGVCNNTIGSYKCRCPQGTYGEPGVEGGCVDYNFNKEDALLPTVAPVPTGLANCSTTCGNVTVPYPFGFGHHSCHWPGFGLICDRSHSPPLLLLVGNGTLKVVHISLRNSTVHIIRRHGSTNLTTVADIGEPYALSTRNEFIVTTRWDLRASLHGEYRTTNGNWPWKLALAFNSKVGLTDHPWHKIFNKNGPINNMSFPFILQWAVKQALPPLPADYSVNEACPDNVARHLCRSEKSECRQQNGGFTCHCSEGYEGNPYLAGGCQDIDECNDPANRKYCSYYGGYCFNFPGGYDCRCSSGMQFNIYDSTDGCAVNKFPTRLIFGLSAASGPVLILVLVIWFLLRKLKQRRIKLLKQKYFKQNRGQLLQQLLSQNVDIAERMIIPLDELAKATNNFDTAREIGGGGHGTVYKGILSDLHVVAIKKSKITVQKEIDEFINEVPILSQVNHKNVVKLFGCCLETEVPLLVYEFISNGTLYHHLHVEEPRSLSWGSRLRIATEIAASLAYLHSSASIPIIHRDIKSSNILLDDTMTSKISDFGASRYIPVDKTGLTTRVQGTIGYLDPMFFYSNRLTDKSDVYSFGVILMELLTRKKPFLYLSSEGDGLVSHFVNLLSEGNLSQIIDPQVMEEGGTEVQEVATLAASCINSRVEERPTMRQVEHTLHGLQGPNSYNRDGVVATGPRNDCITTDNPSLSGQGQRNENPCSRIYSLEQEMMMSARYPR